MRNRRRFAATAVASIVLYGGLLPLAAAPTLADAGAVRPHTATVATPYPAAPQWVSTSTFTPQRPASCTTPTKTSTPNTASAGQTGSALGTVPWPSAPKGSNPLSYGSYLHTSSGAVPTRPANWSHTGGTWKLTSARTNPKTDPTLALNPQELCGVEGNSVDRAWQTTTGLPSTVLAVTDSGIEWCDPAIVDKVYLNKTSLPLPENATGFTKTQLSGKGTTFTDATPFDLHDTGIINAGQYQTDPRVKAIAKDYGGLFCNAKTGTTPPLPTTVTAADLIRTFGTPHLPTGAANPYTLAHQSPPGFTDAIAGWNFVDNTNNPYDDVHYEHGTGEAEDSNGAANTLSKEVGACPSCMVMPIRVGQSFVTTGNMFAQAVLFAVDSGVTVVQEALGTIDITSADRQAIAYATAHGVPIVASAADEEAGHHNLPSVLPTTIVVNSVNKDTSYKPPSYLYLNGCTNYGANISVSVESGSCSSEAAGKASGIVGLAESAAANALANHVISPFPGIKTVSGAPVALSSGEIAQLVTMSASAIDFGKAAPPYGPANNYAVATGPESQFGVTTQRYPSQTGFSQYFGYGRINAASIVTWVSHGKIPPEATIVSPTWFSMEHPVGSLPVAATLGTPPGLGTTWQYQVDVGLGPQPGATTWKIAATGTGHGLSTSTLTTLTLAKVAAMFPAGTDFAGGPTTPTGGPTIDRFTFSIRIVVKVTAGPTKGMIGIARRADYLHATSGTLPGFPRHLTSSLDAPPTLAPIGPDGSNVLIVATAGGTIDALKPDGSELQGWPVDTNPLAFHATEPAFASNAVTPADVPRGEIVGGVAVGDLSQATGPTQDVVACDSTGRCYAWDAGGKLLTGFPVQTDPTYSGTTARTANNRLLPGIVGAPTLVDLTGNGALDIVASSEDRHVYAWQPTGKALPGWPVLVVDPKKVASVTARTNHITYKATANPKMGTQILDTPSSGRLDGGSGPPDLVVATDEEFTQPLNASLTASLGLVASSFGHANATIFAIYPNGTLHPAAPTAPAAPPGTDPGAFLPGWPTGIADVDPNLLPDVGDGATATPPLADISGNGTLDIGAMSSAGPAYVLKPTGGSILGNGSTGKPKVMSASAAGADSNSKGLLNTSLPALGAPVFAPLTPSKSTVSLIAPAASIGKAVDEGYPAEQTPNQNQVDAWNASTGAFDPGFPQQINDIQIIETPIVADVGGGSTPYVVEGSGSSDMRAVSIDGKEAPGFPKFTGGWTVNSPDFGTFGTLADRVLVAGTRTGWLFAWSTSTPTCAPAGPWPSQHHDLTNTSDLSSPLSASQAGVGCPPPPPPPPHPGRSVYVATATGSVRTYGRAVFRGSLHGVPTAGPTTGFAAVPKGYYLVTSAGGVHSFGHAVLHGDLLGHTPNQRIVSITTTADGKGYWLLGSSGGVYAFGDAHYLGARVTGGPFVSLDAATRGYWLVSASGKVYAFGHAPAVTSPRLPPGASITGAAPDPAAAGLWLLSAHGSIFNLGAAPAHRSPANPNLTFVAVAPTLDGRGLWDVTSTGVLLSHGDASHLAPTRPVVTSQLPVAVATG